MEARNVLLALGEKRFGPPPAPVRAALESSPLERLEELTVRLLDVASWDELIA